MRSITEKLTLAFVLVGLTGALLVAAIIQQRTRSAFDRFLLDREQEIFVENLIQYHQENGSWKGIRTVLPALLTPENSFQPPDKVLRREPFPFTLIGSDQTVIYSPNSILVGRTVSEKDLVRAVALEKEGDTIGWYLPASLPREWIPDTPESRFLQTVNRAALLSSLVAILLALLLGGLLAYTLTGTLRELTEATVDIAHGKLGRQVKVRSKDELGTLAASFNRMSQDLDRATRVRRQMTADIAHDLRSPLSVIAGYAEALSDGKLPGSPEVFDILHQETKQLSRLIDDLRTLSLADSGELSLVFQPVHPKVILERAAARHALAAQEKDITLRAEADPGLPTIKADIERISQVMDNLILNAFRYTPPGGEVALSAETAGNTLQVRVRDNGSGIAHEDLPFVFDRFYRGDKSRSQNGESGLGLAIAKSLIEVHGGSIKVESTLETGTEFFITLPVLNSSSTQ